MEARAPAQITGDMDVVKIKPLATLRIASMTIRFRQCNHLAHQKPCLTCHLLYLHDLAGQVLLTCRHLCCHKAHSMYFVNIRHCTILVSKVANTRNWRDISVHAIHRLKHDAGTKFRETLLSTSLLDRSYHYASK